MRAVALVAIILAGCASPAHDASEQRLLACPDGTAPDQCNVRLAGENVNEFSVAANPLDPYNAIIVGNDYGAGDAEPLLPGRENNLWGSWWTTQDGGVTWTKSTLPGRWLETGSTLWPARFVGDLVVTFAADGTAYMAGIAYTPIGPLYRNMLFVTSSSDGGATFAEPTLVDHRDEEFLFHDKPALLARADGSLVVVWNFSDNPAGQRALTGSGGDTRIAISTDGGATWSAAPLEFGSGGISASLAETPDGTLHAVMRTYEPLGIVYRRSMDGMDWSAPVTLVSLPTADIQTANAPYRTFVLPDLVAADGGLHMVVAPKEEDGTAEVWWVRSADGGLSWQTSRLDGGGNEGRFLPGIGAGPGLIAAGWLDRRDDPADADYRFWMATYDTAWREWRIASADSRAEGATTFIGDYLDVAVAGDRVYAAWPDLRDGGSSLYVASLVWTHVG